VDNYKEGVMAMFKLTDKNGCTHGDTQWGRGVTHTATGDESQDLCTDAWIHAYESPYLAVLLNPIHGNFASPRLWTCSGMIGKRDGQLKVGCRELTTIEEIPLPIITTEQRVTFAIRCAMAVYHEPSFLAWAQQWFSGEKSLRAAADAWAAEAAAWADAWAADAAAADAAEAAAAAVVAVVAAELDLVALAAEVCMEK
jgi:hypothetical protein